MSSGDYAHSLKTLGLAAAVRDVTLRPIVHLNPAVGGLSPSLAYDLS